MATLSIPAAVLQQDRMLGAANRTIPVIVGSPHHHYALTRALAGAPDQARAALGADGQGLQLDIVYVPRPGRL
jgi:hypothetical protein